MIKRITAVLTAMMFMFSSLAFAAEFAMKDTDIDSINLLDGYSICTRDFCDESFEKIFEINNISHKDFVKNNMESDNLYLYAMDNMNNCQYIRVTDLFPNGTKSAENGIKTHRLKNDYSVLSAPQKQNEIDSFKDDLAKSVGNEYITDMTWMELPEGATVPYIRSCYSDGNGFIVDYSTILNGNRVSISFSSPNPITRDTIKKYDNVINSVKYKSLPDYEELKKVEEENEKIKIQEENSVDKDKTWIGIVIFIAIAVMIVIAIVFSIKSKRK